MTEKKKLLLIINRLVLGGQSMDAISMAHHLAANYEVTIVYGEKEADEKEAPYFIQQYPELRFVKVPSLRRSILPLQDLKALRDVCKIIKQYQPRIVHTHGFKSGLLGRVAAKLTGVAVIIHTYHGHLFHSYYGSFKSSIICFIERMLSKITTRITAISPQQSYELSSIYRIAPQQKITTIFIGIDTDNYPLPAASVQSLRQQYHIPLNTIIVAIIGRLVPIKNHSFFIEVIQRLLVAKEPVCFFIIGDGYCKTPMQKGFENKGLNWHEGPEKEMQANIYFTSWMTDIALALQDIDIVVLTSLNEGTPVSLIEAQLFERPVVATNVGGVRDTLVDGETGFLVNDFSVAAFAEKLQLLIHNPALRAQMGAKGKAFVQKRFSKAGEVKAIDQLYKDCLTLKNISNS